MKEEQPKQRWKSEERHRLAAIPTDKGGMDGADVPVSAAPHVHILFLCQESTHYLGYHTT